MYVEPGKVTEALCGWLAAAVGFPVGDGRAPAGTAAPYAVLYELPGVRDGAPLGAAQAMLDLTFQVTSVGAAQGQPVPQQARLLGDRVSKAIAGQDINAQYLTPISLPTVVVAGRWTDGDGHLQIGELVAEWVETFHLLLQPA